MIPLTNYDLPRYLAKSPTWIKAVVAGYPPAPQQWVVGAAILSQSTPAEEFQARLKWSDDKQSDVNGWNNH